MNRRRGLVSAAAVLIALIAWVGIRAVFARDHLLKARAEVTQLQTALAAGQLDDLSARLSQIRHEAGAARALTSDPIWTTLGRVPWLGSSLDAAQRIIQSVDQVATRVLPPLVHATDTIDPRSLRQPNGTLKLARLTASVGDLKISNATLSGALGQLRQTPSDGVVPAITSAQRTLTDSLDGLAGSLDTAYRAARIAPAMVGVDGPRRYLVIFQTPAESRGTGGLPGSYAVIRLDHGKVTTERTGSDADLKDAPSPVINLGPDFNQRYGQVGGASEWKTANWTPHYPWAAQVWAKLWQRQSGQRVDGVISVDPIALGYFLDVTGPVTLPDGEVINGTNAARWVMSDSYRIYGNDDQTKRKSLSVELSKLTLDRLSGKNTDLTNLLKVMGRAAGERRLLLWSTQPAEQALIAGTPPAGEMSDAPGPFADLVLRNGSGDKLDYYLNRSLDYRVLSCTPQQRNVRISFTLTNTAPKSGLPAYVTVRSDRRHVPVGQDRVYADLFLANGARLKAWNEDGKPISAKLSIERGHSVVEFDLELPPGQARTVTADVTEPPSNRPVLIPVQPLARPLTVTSSGRC